MRVFLAGLAAIIAFAGTALAFRIHEPAVRVSMRFDGGHTVGVSVDGIARPTPEKLALYPEGRPEQAVHPLVVERMADRLGPPSVLVIYRTRSPEVAAAMKQAVAQLHLEELSPDIAVTSIDDGAPDADATARAIATLDKTRNVWRLVVLLRDDCDGTLLDKAVSVRHSHTTVAYQVGVRCQRDRRIQASYNARDVSRLGGVLRASLPDEIGTGWVATFDVRSLDVIETGDRWLTLDIDGYQSDPRLVTFPAPKVVPPWWDSRLRQIGLGALLVGLISLALRWRFTVRRR